MKMDNRKAAFRQAISCLPPIRRAQLEQLDRPEDIEELRFRAGQPPAARTAVGERPLSDGGHIGGAARDAQPRRAVFRA